MHLPTSIYDKLIGLRSIIYFLNILNDRKNNILQKFVYDGRYRAEHDSQQLQYGIVLYEFDHQVK